MSGNEFTDLVIEAHGEVTRADRDRQIFAKRFALDGEDECALKTIGEYYDISRERVRQILRRDFKRIRFRAMRRPDSACGQLLAFVKGQIDPDAEEVVEQLSDFKSTYLPELSWKISLELIGNLSGGWKQIKSILDERKGELKQQNRIRKARQRFDEILETARWPERKGHWKPEQFKGKMPVYSGRKGVFQSNRLQREVHYQTELERRLLETLDVYPSVTYFLERPFEITYMLDGSPRGFIPNVFCLFEDGRGIVIALRTTFNLATAENKPRWSGLADYCEEKRMGWLITDMRHSLDQYRQMAVTDSFEAELLVRLRDGCMDWPDFKVLRDQHGAKARELVTLTLRHNLIYDFEPFLICLPGKHK